MLSINQIFNNKIIIIIFFFFHIIHPSPSLPLLELLSFTI